MIKKRGNSWWVVVYTGRDLREHLSILCRNSRSTSTFVERPCFGWPDS
jgi:hypothetical protein